MTRARRAWRNADESHVVPQPMPRPGNDHPGEIRRWSDSGRLGDVRTRRIEADKGIGLGSTSLGQHREWQVPSAVDQFDAGTRATVPR